MKLLLTSAGIKNPSIEAALVGLLGKPTNQCNALCIPTAGYGHPQGRRSRRRRHRFISGKASTPMCEAGLEVRGRAGVDRATQHRRRPRWVPWVEAADVLLVNGGDALFLAHWMRTSGLADLLPTWPEKVWVGLSAGSMVMSPCIGADFMGWAPPTGVDQALGVVNFSIFPHLDHPALPENTMADAERWSAGLANPAYAICDDTAIKVVDGAVEVISEGHWRLFTP